MNVILLRGERGKKRRSKTTAPYESVLWGNKGMIVSCNCVECKVIITCRCVCMCTDVIATCLCVLLNSAYFFSCLCAYDLRRPPATLKLPTKGSFAALIFSLYKGSTLPFRGGAESHSKSRRR